jgi:diaminopimelate epimerase
MKQPIQFRKMHGLGNDFVIINAIHLSFDIDTLNIKLLADRHLGIGFDQLLLIEESIRADFACRIFNADGSEAEQCGNGVRCAARFIHEEKLSSHPSITLETKAGILNIIIENIENYDNIQVIMGCPRFEPQDIPFLIEKSADIYETINRSSNQLTHSPNQLTVLSMGNPHAILKVSAVNDFPVHEVGSKITNHPAFPLGTNTGFVEVIDRQHIRLRTFERGSGETFACGSNACAAVVAGIKNGWLDSIVTVKLTYGHLIIEWQGGETPVKMTGPATSVFSGTLTI